MVRRYAPARAVPAAVVDRLLDLARCAPSAGSTQGWHFLVLEAEADRDAFWTAGADPHRGPDAWLAGIRQAPVLIVVLSDRDAYVRRYDQADKVHGRAGRTTLEQRWPVPYWHLDAAMAALLVLLGAADDGLAACFFGVPAHRVDAVRAVFDVPGGLVPVGVISLGHPAGDAPARRTGRQRPRIEVVSYARYGSSARDGSSGRDRSSERPSPDTAVESEPTASATGAPGPGPTPADGN